MNGAHDMGGAMGFGPVPIEPDEPLFHEAWERRAFAVTLAAGFLGRWNIDMARSARESLPPARYLASSYYEIWALGLERLLQSLGPCKDSSKLSSQIFSWTRASRAASAVAAESKAAVWLALGGSKT